MIILITFYCHKYPEILVRYTLSMSKILLNCLIVICFCPSSMIKSSAEVILYMYKIQVLTIHWFSSFALRSPVFCLVCKRTSYSYRFNKIDFLLLKENRAFLYKTRYVVWFSAFSNPLLSFSIFDMSSYRKYLKLYHKLIMNVLGQGLFLNCQFVGFAFTLKARCYLLSIVFSLAITESSNLIRKVVPLCQ